MRLEDYQVKVLEDVGGLYQKGKDDNCPQDSFTDSLNLYYEISEWRTRPGISSNIILGYGGPVRRFAHFSGDTTSSEILLILDDQGNFYTYSPRAGDTATTPRINLGCTDFTAIKMLGKIFIAPSDGLFGLQNQNLFVFVPDSTTPANDVFRKAGGLAPSAASPMVAMDGAAGIVNPGKYNIAVSFITNTGFITPPGPKISGTFTPTVYNAPGGLQINLSNIPIGPVGTTGRQILITKAGLPQYFFLSSAQGGIINDNTTTTTTLNFNDTTDLLNSADYLFNLFEQIPAPLTLENYNGRLMTAGEFANPSIVRGSRVGDPESFDQISGVYLVQKDDGFQIKALFQLRNTLYIWKNLGTFYVTDNGNEPSSWPKPNTFDEFVGTSVHGVSEFYDAGGGVKISRDWSLVATVSGILLFDGTVRKPQVSNKVTGIWQTINFLYFNKLQLTVDEIHHNIYCSIPTGTSTENNLFLMGDYSLCPGKIPESTQIKWTVWSFNPCNSNIRITTMGMFVFSPPDTIPVLHFGSIDPVGKIYSLDFAATTDDGADIRSYWESALLFWSPGNIHNFTATRLRITGSGSLALSIRGEDNVNPTNVTAEVLGVPPAVGTWRFVIEAPHGLINGVNQIYKVCYVTSGSMTPFLLFQNGVLIFAPTYYSVLGSTIQMQNPPLINDTLQALYISGVPGTQFKYEVPSGTIDGVNSIFNTLAPVPLSEQNYVMVWVNGILQIQNTHFIFTGTTAIDMSYPLLVGDTIWTFYHADTNQPGYILENQTANIDGLRFVFTLNNSSDGISNIGVFQNGVMLIKDVQYHVAGSVITLYVAPIVGDTIQFMYRLAGSASGGSPAGGGNILLGFGKETLIRHNFNNEKAKIKIGLNSGNFTTSKVEYYGYPIYPMRPL